MNLGVERGKREGHGRKGVIKGGGRERKILREWVGQGKEGKREEEKGRTKVGRNVKREKGEERGE